MAKVREAQGQYVFGLDIGTRSIVGTVGYLNGSKFHVVAQKVKEHDTRSMLDGQIHDIGKVGETISHVKTMLEDEIDRELTDVCIAAAGRVLRTVTTHVDYTYEAEKEIYEEDINSLNTLGIEKAYEEFQKNNDTDLKFYCVGYSPVRYYLNGYQMGNLDGHKAKSVGIDIIATFLPDDVVDGLYKAVEIAGLHVANLTLEPIAAIQVAIPEKFRMLNMALVDVGAGTSDICITKEGTITAYGMIPIAGDSLTDIIMQHYLVEFDTAERIKRESGVNETIEFEDIIGLPQSVSSSEVKEIVAESIKNMTKQVADEIKNLNGDKPVSAVFVVGGGGTIDGYTESLAEELGIVKERVAIRGKEVMQGIIFENDNPIKDSLMVTPIGICLSYYEQNNNFIFVEFNGERVKLYDNGKLNVSDVAMQCKLTNDDLFPKRGKALTFTVNGMSRMVRGQAGEAAVITINNDPADIYAPIHSGDIIKVVNSTSGDDAKQSLGKLKELSDSLHVSVNGNKIELPKTAYVNGNRENEYYEIKDGDDILIGNSYTVAEIAEFLDIQAYSDIKINDITANKDTRVYENFTVSFNLVDEPLPSAEPLSSVEPSASAEPSIEDLLEEDLERAGNAGSQNAEMGTATEANNEAAGDISHGTSSTNYSENASLGQATSNDDQSSATEVKNHLINVPVTVNVNGINIKMVGKPRYVFVDIFDYIDFDLKASAGRAIVTLLNGRNAEYMETLKNGDMINVFWK